MSAHRTPIQGWRGSVPQRGVVLIISLIMLVTITLGSVALFRQIDSGLMIAGNMAFKSAALHASDQAAEVARTWVLAQVAGNPVAMEQPNVPAGYFPAWCNVSTSGALGPDNNVDGIVDDCKAMPAVSTFDPKTYVWTPGVTSSAQVVDGNGNSIDYVVHRLCRIPGALTFTNANGVIQECVTASASKVNAGNKPPFIPQPPRIYYRITTRTVGPKNTISFTQTMMY